MDTNTAVKVKPVYFFHIPKTSGRFFHNNSFGIMEHELLAAGVPYHEILHGYGHLSYKPLDNQNILSFSILREPVSRTVSHWCHIYQNYLTDNIKYDKKKLLNYLHNNPEKGIIDYQTKYIAYNGDDYTVNIDESGLKPNVSQEDKVIVNSRLSKINYLFKLEYMDHTVTKKSLEILYDHFGLNPTVPIDKVKVPPTQSLSERSKILFAALTKKEIAMVENVMKNDMELYHTSVFTDKKVFLSS
jgi:hypothetical protein